MDRQVLLTLTGRQLGPDGAETVTELTAEAEYYERNGSCYILYQETEDGLATRNILKQRGNRIELTKKGSVNTCMVFEPGREHATDYFTPYGPLRLNICTRSVDTRRGPGFLEMTADYSLEENGNLLSHYTISIKICERR